MSLCYVYERALWFKVFQRGLILGVIIGLVLGFAAQGALDKPEVHVSAPNEVRTTLKCIKVVSPKGERPCEPGDEKRYEPVWVD